MKNCIYVKWGESLFSFSFFLSLVFFSVVEDVPFKLMIPDFSTLHQKDLKCWHFFFCSVKMEKN